MVYQRLSARRRRPTPLDVNHLDMKIYSCFLASSQTKQGYANANGFAITTAPGSTAAQIAAATQSFDLMGGTQVYGKPLNQLDLRASKRLKIGKDRLEIQADLYNVFNSDWVFGQNTVFGSSATTSAGAASVTYMRPTYVLTNRMFKIGGQFDF